MKFSLFLSFCIGFIIMSFEFVAARVLSAEFGGSLSVWGSLISTIMAGLFVGSITGGYITRKQPTLPLFPFLFLCTLSLGIANYAQKSVVSFLALLLSFNAAILVSSFSLYFVPSLFLGLCSPILVHNLTTKQSESKEHPGAGFISGLVSGAGTAGSIGGTLVVSFYWIPAMGLQNIGWCLVLGLLTLTSLSYLRK